MSKFKVGDLVFVLSRTKGVLLQDIIAGECDWMVANMQKVDAKGYLPHQYSLPYIVHATPENRAHLVGLFGEDAVPELPVRGSELTRAMYDSHEYITCWCADTNDDDARANKNVKLIKTDCEYERTFYSACGEWWYHAVPFDQRTGKEIIDLDGGLADE